MNAVAMTMPDARSAVASAMPRLAGKKIRLLPMFPFGVVYGGCEIHCAKTCAGLQALRIDAELLDPYDTNASIDLLHLFGSTGNHADLCRELKQNTRVVVSAISAARSASRLRANVWKCASRLARLLRLQTNYDSMKAVYGRAAAVLCLNRLEADFIHVTYDVPRDRLEIVTNGVEDHYFAATGDLFEESYGVKDFVLFTGNIVERKGPLRLARVLKTLGLPGVFIGGCLASEAEYAAQFAAEIAGQAQLRWIERLSHQDPLLHSAYAAARVFCLPSTSETQSLSALEAMACAKPIILGDFPYAYQDPFTQSSKCNPADDSSLRRALESAYWSPQRYAVQLDDSYRWSALARQMADVYSRVLAP